MADTHLAQRLAERTLELVNIRSVSREEADLLGHIERELRRLKSFDLRVVPGNGLLALPVERTEKPLVILAGHVDTVPEQGNLPGRLERGLVVGLGASDMKGSLAVMLELAAWIDEARPALAVDLGLLFFAREELPIVESAVPSLFGACPELRQAALAIVMEPTDGTLQVGCLGNINAKVTFTGKSAHSARPWHGVNALHAAVQGLQALAAIPNREVNIGGLVYTEVLNLTTIAGGIAQNVIPDRVVAQLNYRYAPDCDPALAEERIHGLAPDGATLEIGSNAPPARVAIDNPLVERLRDMGELPVEPKQAWTPVAEFSAEGLDAVNYGPGATAYAHQAAEQVSADELARSFELLRRFVLSEAAVGVR